MAVFTTELNHGWSFKQSDDNSDDAWLPVAKVPTTVHIDLGDNGKIPDPFVDMSELAVRWVAEKSWTYWTIFPSPAGDGHAHAARTDLVFKGLDTFATVTLNGTKILEADNMFLEYRVDVTKLLKEPQDNVLEIVFDSALLRGRELVKEHEHEHRIIAHQTEASRLPVRKAQCHWGWDWGPILITAGPWRPVLLETYVCRIDDVWFQAQASSNLKWVSGKLYARADIGGKGKEDVVIKFSLLYDGREVFQSQGTLDDECIASTEFHIQDPVLWYPHGYGTQARYVLHATLVQAGSAELATKSKLVGFRRCQLVQEQDNFGKSFYFRVNNVDIFAGGSCWIPADSFLPRIGPENYKKWMELMVEGNQIMIRIWGGGIYEDDAFYSACDELGILVWQDFCFACASYPTYPSFLRQVEAEARYNVRRLRSHPSLVVWAGNNEDYEIQEKYGLDYDYADKNPERWLKSTFPARYIYEHLLPKVVQEEDAGAIYHPSSPWGDGRPTTDPTVGDIHQWSVWHRTMRRFQELPLLAGRFVSEFGMEAYPHVTTIESAVSSLSQRYPGSMVMDFHNRAVDHERRVMTYVAENFGVKSDLASFAHLTQLTQADVMTWAYRSWRRDWGRPGARKCGGALVWQLDDCWPTVSWAVVDYWLRALNPLAVGVARPHHDWTAGHVDPTVATRDNRFDVWVASSLTHECTVDVVVRFISVKTGKDVVSALEKSDVHVRANGTTEVVQKGEFEIETLNSDDIPFDVGDWDPVVMHASLLVDNKTVSTDTAWPQPFKYLDLAGRGVRVSLSDRRKLAVTADKPVHGFVFAEKRDWVSFADNGFDVIPGETKVVEITTTKQELIKEEDFRWTYLGAESGSIGFDKVAP